VLTTIPPLETHTIQVKDMLFSCNPVPNMLIVGTISATSINTLFGTSSSPLAGAPVALSVGYTTDNPPAINNVVEVIAGTVVAYSAAGTGTLTFPAVTTPPPGSTGGGGAPTVLIRIGNNTFFAPAPTGSVQVTQNPFSVDASGSTDPNNLALSYSWASDRPVVFTPSNTVANPSIQFASGGGDYHITVTVTNTNGGTSSSTLTLSYVGNQT
jgi:hypothetical protein